MNQGHWTGGLASRSARTGAPASSPETGEPLTAEDTNDHKRYIHRHNERRATGRKADKLVELVGKINPRIEGELRIYVGRFPWKVAPLLAEAKKMFCKTTGGTRSEEQCRKTVTEETSSAAKSHKKDKDKKGKRKKQHKKNKKKDKKNKTREDGAPAGKEETIDDHMGEPTPTLCNTSPLHNPADELDWADNDSPAEALGGDSPGTGTDDTATPKTPVDVDRVKGGGQEPSSSSLGAQRPRTPSCSPRRATLRPSSRWMAVYKECSCI